MKGLARLTCTCPICILYSQVEVQDSVLMEIRYELLLDIAHHLFE